MSDLVKLAVVGAAAGLAAAAWAAASSRKRPARALRPQFVLFGDSITQQGFQVGGWVSRFAATYERTADIVSRGFSGYNTRWVLPLLPTIFPEGGAAPALVTVLLGANDAARPPPVPGLPLTGANGLPFAGRQHVPLDEYRANLMEIVACIRKCGGGGARVLLITPPPVHEEDWLATQRSRNPDTPADAEPDRRTALTAEYARACVEVGARTGTPVLDLNRLMTAADGWRGMLSDGLHPNGNGGEFIHAALLEAVRAHFPELRPSYWGDPHPDGKLPLDAPDHKAIDPRSAESIAHAFTVHEAERALRAANVS